MIKEESPHPPQLVSDTEETTQQHTEVPLHTNKIDQMTRVKVANLGYFVMHVEAMKTSR